MSDEMIERVARDLAWIDWLDDPASVGSKLTRGQLKFNISYYSKARVAIEAMKEPTDAMIKATNIGLKAEKIYKDMITAALEDKKG